MYNSNRRLYSQTDNLLGFACWRNNPGKKKKNPKQESHHVDRLTAHAECTVFAQSGGNVTDNIWYIDVQMLT